MRRMKYGDDDDDDDENPHLKSEANFNQSPQFLILIPQWSKPVHSELLEKAIAKV